MPTGNASRKAKGGIIYYYLQTATDVIPLMTALLTINFHATLRSYLVNGAATWDLQIEDMRPASQTLSAQERLKLMHLGDVAVWDPAAGRLSAMRIETFQTDYTVP